MFLSRTSQPALLLALAVGCLAGATLGQPRPPPVLAQLSDQGELERVVTLYDAGKYAECIKEFGKLVASDPPKLSDADVLQRARLYYAACLIANGQIPLAEDQIRGALRANPKMPPPDALVFPQPVIDTFIRVRSAMTDELKQAEAEKLAAARRAAEAASRRAAAEKARVERLEQLARREVIIQQNRRWIAAVPFGVGQFQNREPVLGWIFFGTEVGLAGTALGAMVVELSLHARSDDRPRPDPNELNDKVAAARQVMVVSTWAFLGVAAVGIAQAQLAYVPQFRDVRMRKLPDDLRRHPAPKRPELSLRPGVVPTAGGLSLGLSGSF